MSFATSVVHFSALRIVLAIGCAGAFFPLRLPAQSASWRQVASAGPVARPFHAMAFDSQRGVTVLFGGSHNSNQWGDTWEWNGSAWTQVANAGLPLRDSHAMVYDSQRARTVLFGGYATGPWYFRDTWEWDGSTWTQVATTGPSARSGHAMAYDSLRGRIVLFGGNSGGVQADTWEWNGTAWLQQTTASSPSGRVAHAMVFDSQRGTAVLFGGQTGSGLIDDTWEWNGAAWTRVSTTGPAPRQGHAMAYDSARGKTVLFGGYAYPAPTYGDTWEWDGSSWAQVAAAGPAPRRFHAMAYDSGRGLTVLFGGLAQQSLGDTWECSGPGSASIYGSGCGTPLQILSPVANARPVIGTITAAALTGIPSSLGFVALGWSRTMAGPFALPFSLQGHGMPGCYLLQSAEVFAQPVVMTGAGTGTFSVALPNWSGLLGLQVFLQGWAPAPGANQANAITSNGLEWNIGSS
jgi:hypothetical protein